MLSAAVGHQDDPLADEPLADDEEYEDEPDELMAEEAATVLTATARRPPPAAGARTGSAGLLRRPIRWTGRRRRRRRTSTRASSRCRRGPAKAPTPKPKRPPRPRPKPPRASPCRGGSATASQSPTAAAKPEVGPLRSAARRGATRVRFARVDAGAPGDAPEVARRGGGGDPRGAARIGRQSQPVAAHRRRPGRRGRDWDARHVEARLREPAHGGERAADRTGRRTGPGRAARRARARHAGSRAGPRRAARLPGSAAARA